MRHLAPFGLLLAMALTASFAPAAPAVAWRPGVVRVALFNVRELSTEKLLDVDSAGVGRNAQLRAAAEIVRQVDPDILVLNEIDHDHDGVLGGADYSFGVRRFEAAYLDQGERPLHYPFDFAPPCNTGFLSGADLDRNGRVATDADRGTRDHGGDSFGYGEYPGQYSIAVLSRLPLLVDEARSFQRFLWRDLPDPLLPADWYGPAEQEVLRLSSKTHVDLPVQVGERRLHLLLSHPTPPGFDGPEDRNGRRNFDELRLWALYLDGDSALVDDAGRRGGAMAGEALLLVGDLNAGPASEPVAGRGRAIDQLLRHPRLQDAAAWLRRPAPPHGWPDGPDDPRAGWTHGGVERGRRIDHLIPDRSLRVVDGGVVWPDASVDSTGAARALAASDHRLVWLDLEWR